MNVSFTGAGKLTHLQADRAVIFDLPQYTTMMLASELCAASCAWSWPPAQVAMTRPLGRFRPWL